MGYEEEEERGLLTRPTRRVRGGGGGGRIRGEESAQIFQEARQTRCRVAPARRTLQTFFSCANSHTACATLPWQDFFLEVRGCGVAFDGVQVVKSGGNAKGAGCVCVLDDGRVTFFNQPPLEIIF